MHSTFSIEKRIEQAAKEWEQARLYDANLQKAWTNIHGVLSKGTMQSIQAGIELIMQLGWTQSLAKYVEKNEYASWDIAKFVSTHEQPIWAYTILGCAYTSIERGENSWLVQLCEEDISRLAILAGRIHGLATVPEWLGEFLLPALMEMRTVPRGTYGIEVQGKKRNIVCAGFDVCVFPITQFVYAYLMEENPSQCDGWVHPVDSISWRQAVEFCNQISVISELEPVYTIQENNVIVNTKANGFRLPTMEEWQIAAVFDTPNSTYAGGTNMADLGICNAQNSESVGKYLPNALGLYDMSGNVWEWCVEHDALYAYRKGGSWMGTEEACAVDYTSRRWKKFISSTQGFRLFRNIEIEETNVEPPENRWF